MKLEEIKMDRSGFDFYIPLTKVQFYTLLSHLDVYLDDCAGSYCELILDDILAELNYQGEIFDSDSNQSGE